MARATSLALGEGGVRLTAERADGSTAAVTADQVIAALPPRLLEATVAFTPEMGAATARRWRGTPTWMAPHAKFFAFYGGIDRRVPGAARASLRRRGPPFPRHAHRGLGRGAPDHHHWRPRRWRAPWDGRGGLGRRPLAGPPVPCGQRDEPDRSGATWPARSRPPRGRRPRAPRSRRARPEHPRGRRAHANLVRPTARGRAFVSSTGRRGIPPRSDRRRARPPDGAPGRMLHFGPDTRSALSTLRGAVRASPSRPPPL